MSLEEDHWLVRRRSADTALTFLLASSALMRENRAVPYHAQKMGEVRPGLKIHELKADNRAVCGNSHREPMKDLGPGTVTCESCARDTGH